MLLEVFCYGCLISTGHQIWTPSIIFAHPSHLLYTSRDIDRSTRRPCLALGRKLGRVHDLTTSAACRVRNIAHFNFPLLMKASASFGYHRDGAMVRFLSNELANISFVHPEETLYLLVAFLFGHRCARLR